MRTNGGISRGGKNHMGASPWQFARHEFTEFTPCVLLPQRCGRLIPTIRNTQKKHFFGSGRPTIFWFSSPFRSQYPQLPKTHIPDPPFPDKKNLEPARIPTQTSTPLVSLSSSGSNCSRWNTGSKVPSKARKVRNITPATATGSCTNRAFNKITGTFLQTFWGGDF